MPPRQPSFSDERTFASLLGTLDGSKKDVRGECLFAIPVGDIAVLGHPSNQELPEEPDAYEARIDEIPACSL